MKIVYNGEKDRAFKDVLGETIPRMAKEDPDVVYLDADLMSCIGTAKWAKENPDRAINCGIAEANMAGVAAGLSAVGLKPFIHTFGPFASRRMYDQIFLSGGYAGNSVTVIGTDPGVCAAFNGGTHMPFEDMALYRAIPKSYVFDITDAAMLESVLEQCKDIHGVKYIRVGRKNNMKMYEDGSTFEIGKGIVVKEDGFTVKPLDEEIVLKYAEKTGAVVVAENHNKIGGLTSAVCELVGERLPVPIEHVAVEDVFGEVGPQDYLEERFGLTVEHIIEKTKAAIARK